MSEPDYEAMIQSACVRITLECKQGRSVTGLAEWLLALSRDRDELKGGRAKILPFRKKRKK